MSCYKCPHYVRHGKMCTDKKGIVFQDLCGLKMKQDSEEDPNIKKPKSKKNPQEAFKKKNPVKYENLNCVNFPFEKKFDYFQCSVYIEAFDTNGLKNDVLPTKDFQFSEQLRSTSVTEMELL